MPASAGVYSPFYPGFPVSQLKETLNTAVRLGLGRASTSRAASAFTVEARPMHLKAGVDAGRFNSLVDDLDAEAFLAKTQTGRR